MRASESRAKLRDMLGAELADDHQSAPRQFVEDFELVAEHYHLRELGEYAIVKAVARSDLENAITTYAAIAKTIRQGNS